MEEDRGNKIYQVGKCVLTDKLIYWEGIETGDYTIPVGRIWETRIPERIYFDWLLHLAEKSWFQEEDIKDINLVFAFAFDYYERPKDCNAKLSDTLLQQVKDREQRESIRPYLERDMEKLKESQNLKKKQKD